MSISVRTRKMVNYAAKSGETLMEDEWGDTEQRCRATSKVATVTACMAYS